MPGSMDPYLSDKPRAAAALIVAAARASGILMWRLTQARCITVGLSGGEGDVRGRKSERGREDERGEDKREDGRELERAIERNVCNGRGESN